jgi:hypothetical protein
MVHGILIDAAAVYDDSSLELALGVSDAALAKARKAGKLRFTRQGHRILYIGRWVLEWLEEEATNGRAEGVARG